MANSNERSSDNVPYQEEQRVPHDLRYEINNGTTSLLVRRAGGVIRELRVRGKEILTTGANSDPNIELDADIEKELLKIDATHSMLPPGKNIVGPQHGPSRYLEYDIEESFEGFVSLRARDPLRIVGHTKQFELQPGGLVITDRAENLDSGETGMSIGEHLYLSVGEADLSGIRFIDEDGSDTVIKGHREDGNDFEGDYADTIADISEGKTVFFENFSGTQIIEIPYLGRIRLTAELTKSGERLPVCLFMWHRPGTNTVCFEPVAGYIPDGKRSRNDGINLAPGENMQLRSEIKLV